MSLPSPARLAFLSLGLAVMALGAHGAIWGPQSWPLLSALGGGWAVLSTLGVFFPCLRMYDSVVCRGQTGRSEVALTFDDGPHPVSTRRVLEILATTRHRATFFVLGDKSRRHPEVLREIVAAGHALGIHGDRHDRLHSFRTAGRVELDIARAQDSVEAATGFRPRLFRPPLGHTSPATVRGARRAGVTLVGWSARGYDGMRGADPAVVARRVARTLADGAIVLLHDAAERDDFEPAGIAALPAMLALLDERALQSVPLDAWERALPALSSRAG